MDGRDFDAAARSIGRRGVLAGALSWAGIATSRAIGAPRAARRCAAKRGLGEACRRACQCRGEARCGAPRPNAEQASCGQHTTKRNICCSDEGGDCNSSCDCCGRLGCAGGKCRAPLGGLAECSNSLLNSGCSQPNGPWICPETVDLRNTLLSNCDLSNAQLPGALLLGADMSNSTMTGANLDGANLNPAMRATNLVGTNLRQAILTNIRMTAGLAIDTDFSEANLTGALFSTSRLIRANLRGANLTRAALLGSSLALADLTGVIWEDTLCPDGTFTGDNGTCCGHLLPGDVPRAGC
jgi:hypothetical protein